MKSVLVLLVLTLGVVSAQAGNKFKCVYNGKEDISDDARISAKVNFEVDAKTAAITGNIWFKKQTDTGTFVETSKGQASYSGFSAILDDNFDIRVYADNSLLKGKPGHMAVWLMGDGEDSVDLRYDYDCR